MNPKVSIVVIGYNIEKYIGDCLSSVLQQHYDNYEVIYVDDGSRDNSLKIAKDYAANNDNLFVIEKENGGIISAKIEGVRQASGEYLCFVDGDDWVGPELLAELSEGIVIHGGKADIVEGRYYIQRADGSFVEAGSNDHEAVMIGDSYFCAVMEGRIAHYTVAKLYDRQFLLKAGYLDFPHVTMAEDLLTNSLLGLKCPRVHFLECANYYYRYNASSLTHAGDHRILEQSRTLHYMNSRITEKEEYRKLIDYQWFSYLNVYLQNQGVSPGVKKELALLCREPVRKWRKNPYSMSRWERLSRYNKLRMIVYLYLPVVSGAYERLFSKIYAVKHREGRR